MRCSVCGCNAPTHYVEFYQNIGALVMRFSKSVRGNLCKRCINEHFYKFTLTTACVGWFGLISLFVTPIFIINNVVRFCGTIGMKTVDAVAPVAPEAHPTLSLTPDDVQMIEPFRDELLTRLKSGENMDRVTAHVAARAGVSAIQVELFLEKKLAT
jgi:hypothetical protein